MLRPLLHPLRAQASPAGERPWRRLAVAILGFLFAGCGLVAPESTDEQLSLRDALEPCSLGSRGGIEARCGTLEVPEVHAGEPTAGRRTIALRFAVLPAVSRSPQPDPVVFLAGGPGQAGTEAYSQVAPALARLGHDRDILLFDQRGTGASNALDCTELTTVSELEMPTGDELERLAAECAARLSESADLAAYTTESSALDLEALRRALGYPRLNLYGVSYGTRLALAYADLFPEATRTMILDGVVPHDVALGESLARDAQTALEAIFARCAEDAGCAAAFPDPQGDLERLIERLETPRSVRLDHPLSGETVELDFDREMLAGALRLLTYAPESAALVPLLLADAAAEDDLRRLAALALTVSSELGDQLSFGLAYSISCAEDLVFVDREAAREANRGTYLADSMIDGLDTVCAVWPHAELPPSVRSPVRSEVPTLLLSGEADPVTPPAFAERAARTLPNSLSLVAPGLGHNVALRGCIPRLIERFVGSGSVDGLDASCVESIAPPPFFLTPSGPAP